ncbi:hypothetical protein LU699_14830 [Luteimonas fraxinea]|uniref:Uncharacterized protein n=1 Tax=Luteimonas fraxinea TaxID=2901869 RepID=A0ABS8UCD6_9GAMM|nr:hypothetical protein [Luteimonas fraxinea]MCD9097167.1 hypothetical protein [Luteimonas fraxinea]UHH09536.1 hypothetical protein LU699_14830 [Luteimonas fraxinea]
MPHRQPDASTPSPDTLERLAALLRDDDIDAAIDVGLMGAWPDTCADALDANARTLLLATRARLRTAWDARARFDARNARLARRAEERDAARRVAAPPQAVADTVPARPALPSNAAAILARAKARAAGGTP